MSDSLTMVYLNFQLPERELDWLLNCLLPKMNPSEHLWVSPEQEHGDNAQLDSALEKVTGRSNTAAVRLLCSADRANGLLAELNNIRRPEAVRWQMQALLASGNL